jgi:hypothetical protein
MASSGDYGWGLQVVLTGDVTGCVSIRQDGGLSLGSRLLVGELLGVAFLVGLLVEQGSSYVHYGIPNVLNGKER